MIVLLIMLRLTICVGGLYIDQENDAIIIKSKVSLFLTAFSFKYITLKYVLLCIK